MSTLAPTLTPTEATFTKAAIQYCEDVLSDAIPACVWVRAACQRQLDDLDKQDSEDFLYWFDVEAAERVCRFLELMPHVKGKWASNQELIKLHRSHVFILTTIFGWISKKTGYRRFQTAYISTPRKSSKTTITAGVANYMLTADGEEGAEVYSVANTRDQSKICFLISKAMARKSPKFRKKYGVEVLAHALAVEDTNSSYSALSSDANTLDGLSPNLAVMDEVHAAKTREVFDVMETALGARAQPLLWLITTAGFNRSGICFEIESYVKQILNSTLHKHDGLGYKVKGETTEEETWFGIVYTIDEGDDWRNPSVWLKANPLLGITPTSESIARACRKAQVLPSALNNFLTKCLNVWVNADTAFFDMIRWANCADTSLKEEDFEGEPVIIGVDLASKKDIAAVVKVFRKEIEGVYHYYFFPDFYLPEDQIEDSPNSQYQGWARQELFVSTHGSIVDLNQIELDLKEAAATYNPKYLAFDPWQATQMMTSLGYEGIQVVEVGATVKNFSEPLKTLEAYITAGRVHHDGNPILTWMISNTICHTDKKDNIYPNKARPENKIDGVIAILMGLNLWLGPEEPEPPQPSVRFF